MDIPLHLPRSSASFALEAHTSDTQHLRPGRDARAGEAAQRLTQCPARRAYPLELHTRQGLARRSRIQ